MMELKYLTLASLFTIGAAMIIVGGSEKIAWKLKSSTRNHFVGIPTYPFGEVDK